MKTKEKKEFLEKVKMHPNHNYMIKCYSKYGKHTNTVYTDSLKDAKKIRLDHAKKNNITDFPFFPTIWKWTGNDYKRMPGY